jgi:hypothetical protein
MQPVAEAAATAAARAAGGVRHDILLLARGPLSNKSFVSAFFWARPPLFWGHVPYFLDLDN